MTIHCSFCDTVMACSGALVAVEHPYNPPSEASAEGTAAHAATELIIGSRADLVDTCESIADTHNVDLDSLTFLVREARRAWSALSERLPNPQFERRVVSSLVKGRADLVSYGPGHAAVLDWKFGHSTRPHPHQLTAYASALRSEIGMPSSGHIDVIEVHVRSGTWRQDIVTAEHLNDWESQLARRIAHPGEQWAPATETCQYCPARMDCPARAGYLRHAAQLIADVNDVGPTRDSLATVYDCVKALEQALREYNAALNDALRDGPLNLPGGRVLEQRETTRETIHVGRAWPVISRELGWAPETLLELLAAPKNAITKRVHADAPRGEKQARSKALFESLRKAGAIEVSASQRKEVR